LLLRLSGLVKRPLYFRNPHRDLYTALIHLSGLGVHVAEVCKSARCTLGVHLGDSIERAVEAPPLTLDLPFQLAQLLKRLRQGGSNVHSRLQSCSLFVLTLIHPPNAARKPWCKPLLRFGRLRSLRAATKSGCVPWSIERVS